MGTAETRGDTRAIKAAQQALASPLLDNHDIMGSKKILLSIISGEEAELKMDELTTITEYIQQQAGDDAEVIFGHGVDSALGDRIRVTVIATGFANETRVTKKEDKKVHELDRSQISLFGGVDNSVNHRNADLELKVKSDTDSSGSSESTPPSQPVSAPKEIPPVQKPMDRPILSKPEAEEEKPERSYSFTLFDKNQAESKEEDEGEESLFAEDDEFQIGKEISADQVINEDGMMEVRRTKERLEQQAKERREKLKSSRKQEMTKEEFNEKWTLPAYLRRGVKMDNVPHSSEPFISRYNLNDDNNLLGNNKFLHDNVD
jgi:cell division protein FtsZ